MTKSLNDILNSLSGTLANCDPRDSINISKITCDSREVSDGTLFVAISGYQLDGHDFVSKSFEMGASAAIVEREESLMGKPGIVVEDARRYVSSLANYFNDSPSSSMECVGVTGTNGKTTVNWMIYHLFLGLKKKALRVGTLGFYSKDIVELDSLTTPEPISLHSEMKKCVDAGVSSCVMEVASHGLVQHRVSDIDFDVAVFTNLARDHFDYHDGFEDYFQAKKVLFELTLSKSDKTRGIVCIDDEYGKRLYQEYADSKDRISTYGFSDTADIRISDFSQSIVGMKFTLSYSGESYKIECAYIGDFNALNFASAFGAVVSLGYEPAKVALLLNTLPEVSGRLESVGTEDIGIYVDYAHKPQALEAAINTCRDLVKGNLWVVFGCGGDRDKGKRPEMGEIAMRLADKVVVTSDNPRTEDPDEIIKDILACGIKPEIVEVDRSLAIKKAIGGAASGDIVLIAGKGHEDYQILGTKKIFFSDQQEVIDSLKSMKKA